MCKPILVIIMGFMIATTIISCQPHREGAFPNNAHPQKIDFSPTATASTHEPFDTFDYLKALRLMFESSDMAFSENRGRDTVAVNTSIHWSTFSGWNPCNPIPTPPSSTNDKQFQCIKYILTESYYQNETTKILVLTESIDSECHICMPQISGAVFLEQEGDWVLDFKQLNFLSIGSWGQASSAKVFQIGENRFGIFFHHHFASTGISGEEIVIVTEIDKSFKEVLVIDSALIDAEEGWGYESEVVISEEADRDWYDIKVTTTDTRKTEEETKWFSWDGVSYQDRTSN